MSTEHQLSGNISILAKMHKLTNEAEVAVDRMTDEISIHVSRVEECEEWVDHILRLLSSKVANV